MEYSPFYNPEEDVQRENGLLLKRTLGKVQSPGGTLSNTVQPGQSALPNTIEKLRGRATDMYSKATQMMEQPLDYSGLQAFAQQRGQQGEQAMLNALAAQYAGEGFAPLQQQFMKTAASSQDPIKMGGGLITNNGQFIKDPEVAQDKQVSLLLNQAKAYEQQALTAETARDRIEAQRKHDETMQQLRLMGLNLQQQGLGIQAMNAQTQRIVAEANAGGKVDKAADTLRNEYLKRADKVREGTNHAQNVIQMLSDPQIARDPTRQVALIFSFGKMLDPDSVVRESEYALIANARGLADQLQQLVPRLQTGARLTPQQLKSMQEVAGNLLGGSSTRLQDLDQYYADLANRRKINPMDVLPSYANRRGGDGKLVDFNSLPK
jgi:hypothetical protein